MSSVRIQPTTACALSSTIKQHLRPFCFNHCSIRRRRPLRVSMSSSPSSSNTPLHICVKASVITPTKLGDCNFYVSRSALTFCGLE